jgi:hypothetical protein
MQPDKMIDVVSRYREKAAGKNLAIGAGNSVEKNNFTSKCRLLASQLKQLIT